MYVLVQFILFVISAPAALNSSTTADCSPRRPGHGGPGAGGPSCRSRRTGRRPTQPTAMVLYVHLLVPVRLLGRARAPRGPGQRAAPRADRRRRERPPGPADRGRRGGPGAVVGRYPAAPLRTARGVRPGGGVPLSPAASFVSGVMLPVDGGMLPAL